MCAATMKLSAPPRTWKESQGHVWPLDLPPSKIHIIGLSHFSTWERIQLLGKLTCSSREEILSFSLDKFILLNYFLLLGSIEYPRLVFTKGLQCMLLALFSFDFLDLARTLELGCLGLEPHDLGQSTWPPCFSGSSSVKWEQ